MAQLSDYYFEEEKEIICDKEVPSIIEDIDTNLQSVVDRYFTRYYLLKNEKAEEVHSILFHSNRICLVGLAPDHIAFKKGIKSVNFNVGNVDRSLNQVSGKRKKGAMNLQPTSTLAIVECNDGTEYKIVSCVTGKLIEINERLVTNPELIQMEGDGYVAIVLPKPENCENIKKSLMTKDDYDQRRSQ